MTCVQNWRPKRQQKREKQRNSQMEKAVQKRETEIPTVQKDQSSLAIVALRYKVYNEADLEKDGSLDNMTFEEYIAACDREARPAQTPTLEKEDIVQIIEDSNSILDGFVLEP